MKKIVALILASCMLVCMFGCKKEEEADYTNKTITIVYNADNTWNSVIKDYAKAAIAEAFPGLTVEYKENSGEDLPMLSQTGDMPDIIYGSVNTEYLDICYTLLDEYISDEWLEENYSNPDFYKAPNGHIYTLGSGSDAYYTGTWYYNVDEFNRLGLQVPTNFDELVAVVKALQDAGWERPLCFCSTLQMTSLLQECLLMLAPEALDDLCANKTDFNDTRIVEACAKFQELIDLHPFGKGNAELDESTACAEFVAGNTPLLYTMSYDVDQLTDASKNFTPGVFMTPGGHCSGFGSFTSGWMITKDAEDPELAAEVLKVLVQAEAQRNHNWGIVTNFKVEGEVEFVNQLAADRDVLYKQVENWHPWFSWNACDTVMMFMSVYIPTANFNIEDVTYTMEEYRQTLQAGWENNTFFAAYN